MLETYETTRANQAMTVAPRTERPAAVELESSKEQDFDPQRPNTTRPEKAKPLKLSRDQTSISQQNQRNQTSIQRARENRNGQKRSQREILERIFNTMEDGKSRSVSKIAEDVDAAWSTTFWLVELVEFVQSKPRLVREGNMRRKRYYHIAGPRRR